MGRTPSATVAHALLLWAAVTGAASAAEVADLARARNCLNCHGIDRKLVGPAFKDVAARYAGKPGSAEMLAVKIVKGGSGAWGVVPMPANEKVTADEAKRLAAWVVGMK